jgi:hypothetical protein
MLLIHLLQDMPTWLAHMATIPDLSHGLLWHTQLDWSLLSQVFNTDPFAGARNAFDHFITSGQVWAFIVGLIIGYLFRSFTTYG